jgi:hypothetical protein
VEDGSRFRTAHGRSDEENDAVPTIFGERSGAIGEVGDAKREAGAVIAQVGDTIGDLGDAIGDPGDAIGHLSDTIRHLSDTIVEPGGAGEPGGDRDRRAGRRECPAG